MVIDINRCIGCHSCSIACKAEQNVPLGKFKSWVRQAEKGTFPNVAILNLPRLCNHCDKPPCVSVCPTKASQQRDDGIVWIDQDTCFGCKACIAACPYDSRYLDPNKRVADKCDFCKHLIALGQKPACVTSCVGHARHFGDLDDPDSEVSMLVGRFATNGLKTDLGTEPMVFYIGMDDTMEGHMQERPPEQEV